MDLSLKAISSLPTPLCPLWMKLTSMCAWRLFSHVSLCDPMDYSPPGSSIHGILQARILEWVAILFSRGSSWIMVQTYISCIAGRFFAIWVISEAPLSSLSKDKSWVLTLVSKIHLVTTPLFASFDFCVWIFAFSGFPAPFRFLISSLDGKINTHPLLLTIIVDLSWINFHSLLHMSFVCFPPIPLHNDTCLCREETHVFSLPRRIDHLLVQDQLAQSALLARSSFVCYSSVLKFYSARHCRCKDE